MNLQLGEMHAASFDTDPKHLGFVLRRYHFVARMFRGMHRVIEIGCGDGLGAKIVGPVVERLMLSDKDPNVPAMALGHGMGCGTIKWDPVEGYPATKYDAAFSLDVLEHVAPEDEDRFLGNICSTLLSGGAMIVGTPSLESQPYASELSRRYHVNCKTGPELRKTLLRHFHNVFLFGMNDYALHDGFDQMCHYRMAICSGKRQS